MPRETGLLCAPKSADSLADAMARFLEMTPAAREKMGREARLRAERTFDQRLVIDAYLHALGD
jgi:glycosyltransferase involved in cell wall biosynthesis